jgi:hypothetical protein
MSVYSIVTLRKTDALKLIAHHLGIELTSKDEEKSLIDKILFKLTSENPYSDYALNNFTIVDDDYQNENDDYNTLAEPFKNWEYYR